MATTSIRAAVKAWLVDQLEQSADPVAVSNGWPGKRLEREHIWVDRVFGPNNFLLAMSGRKSRDDDFTVRVAFQAAGLGDDIATTDARCEELYAFLEDLIATDPSLDGLDGVTHAVLENVEGPNGELTDEGAVSFIFADVAVKSRLV